MKTIKFHVVEIEGDVTSTDNEKALKIYKEESAKFHKKQSELFKLAYPSSKKDKDIFDFFNNTNEKPKFDIDKKLKSLGYEIIIDYKKPAYFVIKTPFATLKKYKLREKMDFITTDGAMIANIRIEMTIK
jgi:hypothetical protein